MTQVNKKEVWVDNVKVIACVLVVLGHFFQSMIKSSILPESNFYSWFEETIYYFHVPLFFICSGYLYQKYSNVNDFRSWKNNVLKKALSLGIPYFIFSTITWVLKTVFSSSVNDQIGGLIQTLLLHPTSPYWYLYCLFLIFLITPTYKISSSSIVGLLTALMLKGLSLLFENTGIYVLYAVTANEIWFVIGMHIAFKSIRKVSKDFMLLFGEAGALLFLLFSAMVYVYKVSFIGLNTALGLFACSSVILIMKTPETVNSQNLGIKYLHKYTMTIFIMHTLFAAAMRIVLIKVGIYNPFVHIVFGILISFAGPIAAERFMSKFPWLDFCLYPRKYIKIGEKG